MRIDTSVKSRLQDSVESRLRITLLGAPEVAWAGQPVALARRQSRALLYRLATSPQPLLRDQLCFLFWPDIGDTHARRSLTVLLNHLRRELPNPDLIVTVGDTVGLNPHLVWTDTSAFVTGVTAARHNQQGADLQKIVDLYRGAFLNGFALPASAEFEAWATAERALWERRYLEAIVALMDHHTAQGDYPSAIEDAQRYLSTDDLSEEVHRRLIWLYAATGDRTAALRQFERCTDALEREFNVSPSPETWALYHALREGTFASERKGLSQAAAPVAAPESVVPRVRVPLPLDPLIGRDQEVAAVGTLLRATPVRLLTLTGPGGSGKTRLALQVGADLADVFTDGIIFVALAALRDPAMVLDAIAGACGVREMSAAGGRPSLADNLRDYLRDKHLLLILDNFEHLLDAALCLTELLAYAPHLSLLITSRAALHLSGEHVFMVPSLPLPDLAQLPVVDELASQPAVALLLTRAQAHQPAFQMTSANAADLAAICVRLDGLPLAIELAAARLKLLSPHTLLQRLDHQLILLTNGPRDLPLRQQTLRATIDWSYELLAPHEQRLFKRLAVFTGGCTLEAAEMIASDDLSIGELHARVIMPGTLDSLTSLVDKSLVRQEVRDYEPRFTMLETIREYALERLTESDEADLIRRRHARYYLALAEAANLRQQFGNALWLKQLEMEHDNLRAALAWSLQAINANLPIADNGSAVAEAALPPAESALRLAAALWPLWYVHGHWHEGREWLARLLAAVDGSRVEGTLHAQVLTGAGWLALAQGDYTAARCLAEEGLSLSHALAAEREIADAMNILAGVANDQGDYALAQSLEEQSLTIRSARSDQQGIALSLRSLGSVAVSRGEYERATTLFKESLVLFRQLEDNWGIANILYSLGDVAHHQGNYPAAATRFTESLVLYQQMGNRWRTAWLLNKLGEVAQYQGAYERALSLYEESLALFRQLGQRDAIALVLHNLGYETLQQGDVEGAKRLHQESLALFQATGVKWGIGLALGLLGVVATVQGDYAWANRLQEQSLAIWRAIDSKRGIARALNRLGEVAHQQGKSAQAVELQQESLTLACKVDDRAGIAIGLEGVATALAARGGSLLDAARAARLLGAAEILRETLGAPLRRIERAYVKRTVAMVRLQLEEATFNATWGEGRMLPLSHAIRMALSPSRLPAAGYDHNAALAHFLSSSLSQPAQPHLILPYWLARSATIPAPYSLFQGGDTADLRQAVGESRSGARSYQSTPLAD